MKKILLTIGFLAAATVACYGDSWDVDVSVGGGYHRHHHDDHVVIRTYPRHTTRHIIRYERRPTRYVGYWETREEREWVPGYEEKVWVPAVYEEYRVHGYTDADGNYVPATTKRILVSEGHYKIIKHEGYYRTVQKKVWVERPIY